MNPVRHPSRLFFILLLAAGCPLGAHVATNYYVNDASLTGDIYTNVTGDDTKDGKTVNTPMASLKNLITKYSGSFGNTDVIYVDAGTWNSEVAINLTPGVFDATAIGVTIQGAGAGITIFNNNLAGANTNYLFYINASNVVINDMTVEKYTNQGTQTPGTSGEAITIGSGVSTISGIVLSGIETLGNGSALGGNAAIYIASGVTATLDQGGGNCNNLNGYEGGIQVVGANINLTIQNYTIGNNDNSGNGSIGVGGGLSIVGDNTTVVQVTNSTIANNNAVEGGAIISEASLTITGCLIQNNTAGDGNPEKAAAIFLTGGTTTISNCSFTGNGPNGSSTGTSGGAIAITSSGDFYSASSGAGSPFTPNPVSPSVTISGCIFSGNTSDAKKGNDIYISAGTLTLTGNSFSSTYVGNVPEVFNAGGGTVNITNCGTVATLKTSGAIASNNNGASPVLTAPTPPTYNAGNCNAGQTILPVQLVQFAGQCVGKRASLFWQTASETNNRFFQLAKTRDGINFKTIGSVNGAETSTSLKGYNFVDPEALEGPTYYRLSQEDYNGTITYFRPIVVQANCSGENEVQISVFPNPSSSLFTVNLLLSEPSFVSTELFDGTGRVVKKMSVMYYQQGLQSIEIDANDLSSGVYFLKVLLNNQVHVLRLIKL